MKIETCIENKGTKEESLIIAIKRFRISKISDPLLGRLRKKVTKKQMEQREESEENLDFIKISELTPKTIENKKVSIIIPTYNYHEKLSVQIESLLNQTYKKKEIIIVNDNPKRKLKIPSKENIKVINNKKNEGRGQSRNIGAREATGELLIFMDGNVVLHDKKTLEKINRFYSVVKHNNIILKPTVLYDYEKFMTDEFITGSTIPFFKYLGQKEIPERLSKKISVFWSDFYAIRKDRYTEFDKQYGQTWGLEDLDFALTHIKKKMKIFYTKSIVGSHDTLAEENNYKGMIKKYMIGTINLKKFVRKWNIIGKKNIERIAYGYMYFGKWELSWHVNRKKSEKGLQELIHEQYNKVKKLLEAKEHLVFISKKRSIYTFEQIIRLISYCTVYAYRYLQRPEEISLFVESIFKKEEYEIQQEEPKRIMFISRDSPFEENSGGIATYYKSLFPELTKQGFETHIICNAVKNRRSYYKGEILVHPVNGDRHPTALKILNAITFNTINSILFSLTFNINAVKKLRKIHKHEPIDVLEVEDGGGIGILPKLMTTIPVITRLHTGWYMAKKLNNKSIKTEKKINLYTLKYWEKLQYLLSDRLLANSFSMEKMVREVYGQNGKIDVLHCIYKHPTYEEKKAGYSNYVLFVGRMEGRKGIKTLAKAIRKIFQITDVKLVIAGKIDYDEDSKKQKKYLLKFNHNYKHRIIFAGNLKRERVFDLMRESICTVLPSDQEAFGYTATEAMSVGSIVVASKATGLAEQVKDAGFLVQPRNANELAEKIHEAITTDKRKELKEKAKEHAKEFSPENMIEKYKSYYLTLCK